MSDVCLIVEGSFPYVRGGVSTWVYNLVRSLPDIDFSLVTISAEPDGARQYLYSFPDNVSGVHEIHLHDYGHERPAARRHPRGWEIIRKFYNDLRDWRLDSFDDLVRLFSGEPEGSVSWREFFYSKTAWDILESHYCRHEEEKSFIDYFWTWRFTHLPLFNILTAEIPRARVYHTISTGYAGLLGAIAKVRYGAPLLLTEHGIYTNERKIEIISAEWIFEETSGYGVEDIGTSFFKNWWINLFSFMSRVAYQHSDKIITLYGGNQALQIEEGAPPEKLEIIPNGISADAFEEAACGFERKPGERYIGFVGRVVPIKDVKTFIKAVQIVASRVPGARALILGPTDEDAAYYDECLILTRLLGLDQIVTFTGPVDMKDYYPGLDVVVLTSLSEAMPLVILEAHAQGVPCVASDVGACSELLHGRSDDDRALGPSGIVTSVASPQETADAICAILSDPDRRLEMSKAGRERVRKFYDERDLMFHYFDLYRHYMNLRIGA